MLSGCDIHGFRSPHLCSQKAAHDFNVVIEGNTIRLVHSGTGRVFVYLWFKDAPYLRNGTVRPGASDDALASEQAVITESAALSQLSSARLVEAA